ncbi:hypothetical protein D3X12_27645 [Pseudomonas protegens]|nr:hypothetical protein CEP86_32205 [Pseudomonas protegens]PNW00432.1 hypothetical protein C1633_03540 [Pseudomonas protegens]QEZ54169.1 hypothetical protein D3X12_27645 [Pseudomonas protegens]QEZ59629.1 hypothetical protein D4N38_24175 [Pseudomonas protegens]QEZ65452.1 hypothetical protein D4N37_22975 [Pseudomonas protegens]
MGRSTNTTNRGFFNRICLSPSARGWPLPLKPDKIARLRRPASAGHPETLFLCFRQSHWFGRYP